MKRVLDQVLAQLDLKTRDGKQVTGRLMDDLILKEVVMPLVADKPEARLKINWHRDAQNEKGAPFYSGSVDDALEIVELMLEKKELAVAFYQNVRKLLDARKEDCALVKLFTHDRPAESICVAALLAVKGIGI